MRFFRVRSRGQQAFDLLAVEEASFVEDVPDRVRLSGGFVFDPVSQCTKGTVGLVASGPWRISPFLTGADLERPSRNLLRREPPVVVDKIESRGIMAPIPSIRSKILQGFEDGYPKLSSIHVEILKQPCQCAFIVYGPLRFDRRQCLRHWFRTDHACGDRYGNDRLSCGIPSKTKRINAPFFQYPELTRQIVLRYV